ncbi:MAG: nitric oxide reductase transcriptional regulator NorR, partial [Achromobacter pestifer]
ADRNDIVTLGVNLLDVSDHGAPISIPSALPPDEAPAGGGLSLRDAVDAYQRQAIRQALRAHQDNWAHAARALDVDASNLHKLARRLGLKP